MPAQAGTQVTAPRRRDLSRSAPAATGSRHNRPHIGWLVSWIAARAGMTSECDEVVRLFRAARAARSAHAMLLNVMPAQAGTQVTAPRRRDLNRSAPAATAPFATDAHRLGSCAYAGMTPSAAKPCAWSALR